MSYSAEYVGTEAGTVPFSPLNCPYVERIQLLSEAYQVSFETVVYKLKDDPEWLLELGAAGNARSTETEVDSSKDHIESVIADFSNQGLAESPSVKSSDASQSAKDRICMESFNKFIDLYNSAAHKILDDESLDSILQCMIQEIAVYDKELQNRATVFFAGSTVGVLDYMLWPWIERLPVLEKLFGPKFPLEEVLKDKAALGHWIREMKSDPLVAGVLIPTEALYKYVLGTRNPKWSPALPIE